MMPLPLILSNAGERKQFFGPPGAVSVSATITISIRSQGINRYSGSLTKPLELGRIDPLFPGGEQLFVRHSTAGREAAERLPIADPGEIDMSRRQVRLERLADGRVGIHNLSGKIPLKVFDAADVLPGATAESGLPVTLQVGRVVISVARAPTEEGAADAPLLRTLQMPTRLSNGIPGMPSRPLSEVLAGVSPEASAAMVGWWRNIIAVLQSASNSEDFFQRAAQALVRLIGLDLGAVYLLENGAWRPAAMLTAGATSARPSTQVLGRVLSEKRTFWNRVDPAVDVLSSMASIEAYVAAPILDREENCIGALYGHRSLGGAAGRALEISQIEALLVETLACGVAAGLARLDQEKAAIAQKVQFEQFFSPELSAQLEAQPDLLRGRDAEITVMFCDLRNFSGVTERLGPAQTMDWIGGVLSTLSDEVAAVGGVLVDYVGDELLAMWGAPSPQENHAVLACRAAQLMLQAMPAINARWQAEIGCPTAFGIGLNSAVARVGNTGSTRRFKYGPLGNGVNLASRVQGATKYLRVPAIITGATQRALDATFLTRHLCTVRVVNIVEPVDLHELDALPAGADGVRAELFALYETARRAFDTGNFSEATSRLGDLLGRFPQDGPALVLLSRAVDCMLHEPAAFSPVWTLPGK